MAHVVIVGAGVVGCATAWALVRAGHTVALVDRHAGPCRGASMRNGAQLSYAYADALATPGLLAQLPRILAGRDPAFRLRLQADPEFLVWALRFFANMRPSAFRDNTARLTRMAARTQALMPEIVADLDLVFDHAASGKMILHADERSLAKARENVALKSSLGMRLEVLDRAKANAIEPALAHYRDPIAGVVYSPADAVGRPSAFCEGVVRELTKRGKLEKRFGCEATGLVRRAGRAVGALLNGGAPATGDAVVVATGYGLSRRGPFAPPFSAVWPVQGYSATFPATAQAMACSITDIKRKLVFARLGDKVRIAGIADIGRRDFAFVPERFDALLAGARAAFGAGFDHTFEDIEPWSEARPCTPSSSPLIGPTAIPGLWRNLGHGTLGWTLCLSSAEMLVEEMQAQLR
ncbi:MAG: FAD-dependent oxidoreductase [Salinarimonadaceae bacterium]|nr:MAG: FAD-dependent oxidoreductase [Salinarimonadaceae bacterium]